MSAASHAPVKAAPVPKPAPKPALTPARGALLQRKCACGGKSGGSCSSCQDDKLLQRRSAHHHTAPASIPSSVHSVLQSPGRPLDAAARSFMEPRFGHDFGHVRVHTGAQATESARAVDARAYTVGNHIAFDQGEYSPHSHGGRQLLAHELAHTIQQHGIQRAGRHLELGDSPAYSHLEREADSLADRVMRAPSTGHSAGPLRATHRPLQPVVARAARGANKRKWEPVDPTIQAAVTAAGLPNPVQVLRQAQYDRNTFIFELDTFYLPGEKGPIRKYWEAAASASKLETFIEFSGRRPRVALKQVRVDTDVLRSSWFQRVGWTKQNAPQRWCECGGPQPGTNRLPGANPIVMNGSNSIRCDFDHIVELQLGGVNVPANLQVLDEDANVAAGRGIFQQQLLPLAQAIRDAMPAPQPHTIGLHFNSVAIAGTEQTCGAASTANTATSCYMVECTALAKAGTPNPMCGATALPTPAATVPAGTEPYPIRQSNIPAVIYAPIGQETVDLWSTDDANKMAAEIVPGLLLTQLHRGTNEVEEGERGKKVVARSTDVIEACMEGVNCAERIPSLSPGARKSTRIPISFRNEGIVYFRVEPLVGRQTERRIVLDSKSRKLEFLYPYLSKGSLDLKHDTMGFVAKGKIQPEIPLLKDVPIGITISEGSVWAGVEVPKEKLKLPFPGVRVTRASLGVSLVPEFDPRGELDFEVGPAGKPAFTGSVIASKDDNGLRLDGLIQAHLPGVSKAEGKLEYSNKQWSGGIDIGVDNFKLPGLQSAKVHVGFAEDKFEVSGGVTLQLPGGQTAEMSVTREGGRWVYKGSGIFKVPRLDPVKINVTYDGRAISGSVETGFTYKKLSNGKIKVFYESKPGAERPRIWGEGSLEFTKGRAKGKLTVKMSERGRFSGDGSFEFEIKKGLIAKGRLVIDEDEEVTIEGELRLPTYRLFDDTGARSGRQPKPLIEINPPPIPTPLSLGGKVGLLVKIHGGIYLSYGFGPVDIEGGYIATKLKPLEEDKDFSVEVGGKVVARAFLSVTGAICGELVLDLLIAEAGGGLGASITATLYAKGEAVFKAAYSKDEVSAAITSLSLGAGLDLTLKILAYVWASVGVWRLKYTTGKTWDLASFTFKPGELGMRVNKPLGYSSKSGFMIPSFDDIEWVKPNFDAEKAIKQGFGGNQGDEEKGKKSVNPCKDV